MTGTYAHHRNDPFERIPDAIHAALSAMADAGRKHQRHGGGRHRPHQRDFGFGRDFPFGGPPFGRGRRARRGDVRAAALVLLDEEPRNGYQLMQELERRSQGAWRPSSGSVYPTLSQLEDEGLVAATKDESNRVYRLTERGKSYVAKHRDELGTPWEVETSGHDPRWELMNLMREIGPALGQVMKFGTPEQVAEARRIMTEARRALYRLLADDETAE